MSPQGRKVLDLGLPLDPPRIFAAIHPRAHRRRLVIRADSVPHSLTSLQPRTSASTSVVRCGTRQPTFTRSFKAGSDSLTPVFSPIDSRYASHASLKNFCIFSLDFIMSDTGRPVTR